MVTQSKTIVDAAKRANVQHIVHLGVFSDKQSTDPHFVWHELVESYIQASGIAWTHLHPNMFMENLLTPNMFDQGAFLDFFGGNRMGLIAAADIARVGAVALREGPAKHGGRDYWLSTEVLTMKEVAGIVGEVLGKKFDTVEKSTEADFDKYFASSPVWNEIWYLNGIRILMRQIRDGQMGYISTTKDDVPFVTGGASLKFKEWVIENKEALLNALK